MRSSTAGSLPLGGSKQRAVLAMLALRANRTVSADELIDGLWGDRPPASAAKNVQLYVSRLRKALASDDSGAQIVTRGRGYELQLPEDAVDAARFERLVERARREAEQGIADGAAQGALELWQGAPLADVAEEPFAGAEIRRLEELHLRAIELAIDAELAAGRHAEVIGTPRGADRRAPAHERFHAQRMLALYRAGRQSEAVEGYRAAHRTLVEEIGVEPGPELRELQEADPRATTPPSTRARRRASCRASSRAAPRCSPVETASCAGCESAGTRPRRGGPGSRSSPVPPGSARPASRPSSPPRSNPRAAVLYAAGSGAPDAALEAIRGAEESELPTLLVLDDADDASPALLEAAAALAAKPRDSPLLLLVLHRDEQGPPAFADAAQRLALRPLRVEAAAEIAELYAPADGVAMPLETLMADSEGVPLRVHRAASGWAQAQAAERLEATAGRAATERGGLRAAEAEVAGGVTDLQLARERTEPLRGRRAARSRGARGVPVPRPRAVRRRPRRVLLRPRAARRRPGGAPGRLHPDRGRGAVRERQVLGASRGASAVARRRGAPRLGALAPGGDAAGRAPARGARPRAGPRRAPARASPTATTRSPRRLTRSDRTSAWCWPSISSRRSSPPAATRRERAAFAEALAALAADADQRVVVVLGIRGDFYGRCAEYPELAAQMSANTVLVGPMRRDELRRAIELPARRAGLRVEPSLVSALIGDVADEPGGLPLLSTTLVELWEERSGRTLREASYEASGGVSGAVARLAERAYRRLSEPQRERARAILLRLSDAEEAAPVRRRVPLAELETERDEDAAAALAVLTESRLVTVDEGTVEVAHEALLSRVAAPPRLARGGRRGPAPSPAPDPRRRGVAGLRARSRRALPRRPARLGARVGIEPRSTS